MIKDTSKNAEKILIEGYAKMPAWKKLRQVTALTQTVQKLALSRIKEQYGDCSEYEQKLRLASLWIPRDKMIKYFNWDPEEKGY